MTLNPHASIWQNALGTTQLGHVDLTPSSVSEVGTERPKSWEGTLDGSASVVLSASQF